MMFQKLLKLTIADALDRVWSESGIIPSKRTRETIIKAAMTISKEVQNDFIRENKGDILHAEKWENILAAHNWRTREHSDGNDVTDESTLLYNQTTNA